MNLLNLEGLKAYSVLWIEFVKEVRWHWEHRVVFPGVEHEEIDLDSCLLHQKLQMVR